MTKKIICASIMENTLPEMVSAANKTSADLVELRVDHLKEKPDFALLKKIKKPIIATCMPKWEGGLFSGSEEARIKLLQEVLPYVQYVTIEFNTKPTLRDSLMKKAKKHGVKVILAFHDFEKTPSLDEMLSILARERDAGADIAKVAFTPKNEADVLNILRATMEHNLKIPVITLSMGELGRASRIVAPLLGSYLTYAAVSNDKKAASGQLSVEEVKKIFAALSG